jgi:hypothetical protein
LRSPLKSSLVIAALTFSIATLAPLGTDVSTAYAAAAQPFSRGLALRECRAEAREKHFGLRIFARGKFVAQCIKKKRAAQ